MERAGNGASGKRCDIDGVDRTGELAGVSESSRDIDGQTREGERAGENESIGRPRVSANTEIGRDLKARPLLRIRYGGERSEWHERSGSRRTAREAVSECGQQGSFKRSDTA